MALVSLKVTKKEREAERKKWDKPCNTIGGDEYGYGLRVSLDDRALEKLGMETLPRVGKKMTMTARVEVIRTSQNQSNGGEKRRDMELQIQALEFGAESAESAIDDGIAEAAEDDA